MSMRAMWLTMRGRSVVHAALEDDADDAGRGAAQREGSFEPAGFSSTAQKPISVSSLSASATVIATLSRGSWSDGPCGL